MNTITPCCGGGTAPADKEPWQFDANNDKEINWAEQEQAEQEYDDGTLTEESYDRVYQAYLNDAVVSYPDPDDDGMTIREEELWTESGVEMAKYATNTDDDGFSDFRDKRPQVEDQPPEVNLSFDSKDEVTVSANDNEGLARVSLHEAGTYSYTDRPLSGTSAEETFNINTNTEYWVNVSDNNGNEYGILFESGSDGSVEVKKAGFAVMAFGFASPVPGDEIATTPAAVTMVIFAATIATVLALGTSGESKNLPYTGSENAYEDAALSVTQYFTDAKLPVRLPSGFSEEIPDPAGGSLHRGHGWEYIQLTLPGITQNEIGDILRYPSKVEEIDDGALVIGDNPNGQGDVWILIVEGTILTAANVLDEFDVPDDYDGEYSDRRFALTREDWDHVQDRKDHLSRQQIRETVQNPDEIWIDTSQGLAVFIREVNGEHQIVRMWDWDIIPGVSETYFHVGTAYSTDQDGYEEETNGLTKDYP